MIDITANTLSALNKTTSKLLHILYSTSEEELNFRPGNKWSIGQIGDHLLKSYASVETLLGNTKTTERPMDQKLGPVKTLFLDMSIKMDSPKAILPSMGRIDKKELIKGIEGRREQTRKVILNKDLSLTCTDYAIPEYGEFTRFEWIWFNIYHTQRHIQQLEDVIALNRKLAGGN